MASCFYNGVLLPEIPSDALKNYPYCWIRNNTRTGYYDLMMAKSPWWQSDSTTIYTASYADGIQWYRTPMQNVGDDWTFNQSWTTNGGMADESDRNIIWANQNIPTGTVTATTIYFVGSSAVPDVATYQIKKDTVVDIADQVRRLCKTEATMTPAVIKSNLEGLNIELMETYVTSDGTEQVIYPDEGYYGFSKITVGAVDLSGGGGGSGGEETEDIPSAESVAFGGEYTTTESVVSMTYTHTSTGSKFTLPAYPEELEDYPYYFVTYKNGNMISGTSVTLYLYTFNRMWDHYQGNIYASQYAYVWQCTITRETADDDFTASTEWTYYHRDGAGEICMPGTIIDANHTITTENGTVIAMPSKIVETEETVSFIELDREELYTISGATLNQLGMAVQALTGGQAMTPRGMAAALQNSNS